MEKFMKKLKFYVMVVLFLNCIVLNANAQSTSKHFLLKDIIGNKLAYTDKLAIKDVKAGSYYTVYEKAKIRNAFYMLNTIVLKKSMQKATGAYNYQISCEKKDSLWSYGHIYIAIGKNVEIDGTVYDIVSSYFNEEIFKKSVLKPKFTSINPPENFAVINGVEYKMLLGGHSWFDVDVSDFQLVDCDIIQLFESQREIPSVSSLDPIKLKFQHKPYEYLVHVYTYPRKYDGSLIPYDGNYYMPDANEILVLHLEAYYEQGGGQYYLKIRVENK
jgi:hypothetical protein